MSSAFDTIQRDKIMEIANEIFNEDEVRILRILLSETTLEIKIKGAQTTPFKSNIGSPQGDALSGCLFTIYFEASLRKFREKIELNNITQDHSYAKKYIPQLPEECIYADDADFITTSQMRKTKVTSLLKNCLEEDNLLVNDSKTEHTTMKRQSKEEESWRYVKKLGSLLGDAEDVIYRKQQAINAIRKLENVWIRHYKISPSTRLKLFNTYVKPVL